MEAHVLALDAALKARTETNAKQVDEVDDLLAALQDEEDDLDAALGALDKSGHINATTVRADVAAAKAKRTAEIEAAHARIVNHAAPLSGALMQTSAEGGDATNEHAASTSCVAEAQFAWSCSCSSDQPAPGPTAVGVVEVPDGSCADWCSLASLHARCRSGIIGGSGGNDGSGDVVLQRHAATP